MNLDLSNMADYVTALDTALHKRENEGGTAGVFDYGGARLWDFDPDLHQAAKDAIAALDNFEFVLNKCEQIGELYKLKLLAHSLHYRASLHSEMDWMIDVKNSCNPDPVMQTIEALFTFEQFKQPTEADLLFCDENHYTPPYTIEN